ncbi:MAG: MBOAT family O-acyltransferase, partial [Peptococcales bacterium]
MVFSSTLFIFLFLPVVLGVYYLIRDNLKNYFLTIASLFFYAWGEPRLIFVMLLLIIFNYYIGLLLGKYSRNKFLLGFAVLINLSFLIFYKYINFIVGNLNLIRNLFNGDLIVIEPIVLPIGISFFTFQALSYVIDVYRGNCPIQKNPINIALYISLFPQLIAGPIVRYYDIAQQIVNRNTEFKDIYYGIQRFIIGLSKKVLIANKVANVADEIFSMPVEGLTVSLTWLGIICYTLQIYFDFSGYSDMAIGLGRLFGFKFLENFNYPYISSSIKEFWRRWHISLSNWFRDYVYIPLGGSRCNRVKLFRNLIIVFFLTGLWHGASWNFIIWGLWHGLFLIIERIKVSTLDIKKINPLKHIYTLIVVMIGWVFFRADSLPHALKYIGTMFGFVSGQVNDIGVFLLLDAEIMLIIIIGIIASTPFLASCYHYTKKQIINNISMIRISVEIVSFVYFISIFALSIMSLASS